MADVLAVSKRDGIPLEARNKYMAEIVAERLTGRTQEHYVSGAMQWGLDYEPLARDLYELTYGDVVQTGFVTHPRISAFGASPDGLVGEDGLIEIKCLTLANHIMVLDTEAIDPRYYAQIQAQLSCTERAWCDYFGYYPELNEFESFVKRIERDDVFIADAEANVETFLAEVTATVDRLRKKRGVA